MLRKHFIFASFGIIGFMLALMCFVPEREPTDPLVFHTVIPSYENTLKSKIGVYTAGDLQAAPLMKVGIVKQYRTDFIGTVVLAINKDMLSVHQITGWNSLKNGSFKVALFTDDVNVGKIRQSDTENVIDINKIILSIAAGLDSKPFEYHNALELLEHLYRNGRLVTNVLTDAPVKIMMDFQAVQLKKQGANIEIVVPTEGTLSFPYGVMSMSDETLPEVISRDTLLAGGFRLLDGGCDTELYPQSSFYIPAKRLTDFEGYGQKIRTVYADFKKQVLDLGHFNSANTEERFISYFAFLIMFTFWSCTLLKRISEKRIRQYFTAIALMIGSWMLLRIVKLQVEDNFQVRLLWYLYYLFMLFLPTILYWIGLEIGDWRKSKFYHGLKWSTLSISSILFLIVLTNDLHQWVFQFEKGIYYFEEYRYNFIYFFIFIWIVTLINSFVVAALHWGPKKFTTDHLALVGVLVSSFIYWAGYAMNISAFTETELSLTYGVLSLTFIECCLRTSLIPNNTKYRDLFQYAAIDLHILNTAFENEYETLLSTPLPSEIIYQMKDAGSHDDEVTLSSCPFDENVSYIALSLHGGYAVLTKHLDAVTQLYGVLKEQSIALANRNNILSRTKEVERERSKVVAQQALVATLEQTLKGKTAEITAVLDTIPEMVNATNEVEIRQKLAIVKLFVNYCKRRGNLMVLEMESSESSTSSLILWLKEILSEAEACGISGTVTGNESVPIQMHTAVLLYDFFQSIIEHSLAYLEVIVMARLIADEQYVKMRIAISAEQSLDQQLFLTAGRELVFSHKSYGTFEITIESDRLILDIAVPMGAA